MVNPIEFGIDFFDDEPLGFSSFANLDEVCWFGNDAIEWLGFFREGSQQQSPTKGDGEKASAKEDEAQDRRSKLQEMARTSYDCVGSMSRRLSKASAPRRISVSDSSALTRKRNARQARRATNHVAPALYDLRYQREASVPVAKKRRLTIEPNADPDGRPRPVMSPPPAPGPSAADYDYKMLCREGMRRLSESMKRTELSRRQVAMQRARMGGAGALFLGVARRSEQVRRLPAEVPGLLDLGQRRSKPPFFF